MVKLSVNTKFSHKTCKYIFFFLLFFFFKNIYIYFFVSMCLLSWRSSFGWKKKTDKCWDFQESIELFFLIVKTTDSTWTFFYIFFFYLRFVYLFQCNFNYEKLNNLPWYKLNHVKFFENDCLITSREMDSKNCLIMPTMWRKNQEMEVVYFLCKQQRLPE